MRTILVMVAVSVGSGSGDGDRGPQDAPFKSLIPVAKNLNRGIAEVLKGAAPAGAFKPWVETGDRPADLERFKDALKRHEIAAASCFGLELSLQLSFKGTRVRSIESFLHVTETECAIVSLRAVDRAYARSLPLKDCTGDATPFATAADALLASLRANKPETLPFADPKKIEKLIHEPYRAWWLERLQVSTKGAKDLCAQLAALEFDEVSVRTDEQWFSPQGADGSVRGGWIRGRLQLLPEGKVGFSLSRFEDR